MDRDATDSTHPHPPQHSTSNTQDILLDEYPARLWHRANPGAMLRMDHIRHRLWQAREAGLDDPLRAVLP